MLMPEELIERRTSEDRGPIEDLFVTISPWTNHELKHIGRPFIIGHITTGFVGAIIHESSSDPVWVSDTSWRGPEDAEREVQAEAIRRRKELRRNISAQ